MAEAIVQQELQALETFVQVLVQNYYSISDWDAADFLDSRYSWLEPIKWDCKLFWGLVAETCLLVSADLYPLCEATDLLTLDHISKQALLFFK